jgi:L-lactate dehydrogenase complex protein LldG
LQQKMLERIRASLGHTVRGSAPERLPVFLCQTSALDSQSLIAEFESESEKVGGQIAQVRSRDEVTAYLQGLLVTGDESSVAISDGFLIERLRLREWLLARKTHVVTWPEKTSIDAYKRQLLQCGIGVTCADYALADTGTVVLLSGREHHRLISLLPPVHVCLLPTERILPNLPSLLDHVNDKSYSRERPPHALTCITGPSRTADIEQTITTGVHGPKALHVLLYSTETSQV